MCPPYELMRPTYQYVYIHIMMAIRCCVCMVVHLMALPDEDGDEDGNELLPLRLRSLGPGTTWIVWCPSQHGIKPHALKKNLALSTEFERLSLS